MDRKRLMRKKKSELLGLLRKHGKKADPKTLKKDLVEMLLEAMPASARKPATKPITKKKAQKEPAARSKSLKKIQAAVQPRMQEPPPRVEVAPPATSPGIAAPEAIPAPDAEALSSPAELPRAYGEDRIVAMVRDPHWVFAYWELTPGSVERTRHKFAGDGERATIALRVYDTTGVVFTGENANSHYDIEVGNADNWYINTGRPTRSYCLDIGLLSPRGAFATIARSNPADTPRADMSEEIDERWMSGEEELAHIQHLIKAFPIGESSAELIEMMKKQLRVREEQEAGGSLFSMTVQKK